MHGQLTSTLNSQSSALIRRVYMANKDEATCVDQNSLCSTLQSSKLYHLPLLLTDEILTVEQPNGKPESELHVLDSLWGSRVTLRSILADQSLRDSPRLRCILAFVLARAFWQFIGTAWMPRPWTTEEVHFMSERRNPPYWGYYLSDPFVLENFNENTTGNILSDPLAFKDHVQSFGMMLLELEKGICLKDKTVKDYGRSLTTKDMEVATAQRIVRDDKEMKETPRGFRKGIEECLYLTNLQHRHDADRMQRLRIAILQEVVTPLRQTVCTWVSDPENIISQNPDIVLTPKDCDPLPRLLSCGDNVEATTVQRGTFAVGNRAIRLFFHTFIFFLEGHVN